MITVLYRFIQWEDTVKLLSNYFLSVFHSIFFKNTDIPDASTPAALLILRDRPHMIAEVWDRSHQALGREMGLIWTCYLEPLSFGMATLNPNKAQ